MRWDFLYRYQSRYSPTGGFNRLLNQGFSFDHTMIPYMPTITGCGHASIYTGTVPAVHGITGNNWWDQKQKREVYCSEDKSVQSVGSNNSSGQMSPQNLWVTTIGDELKLATNFRSKVVGIALKDRGSILPAGHTADAAYWFDNKTGNWITSSYYTAVLPSWVKKINEKKSADQYYQKGWSTLEPIEKYSQSTQDMQSYEAFPFAKDQTGFPYDLSRFIGQNYEAILRTPFGNTITFDFAKAAVEEEEIGKDSITDLLTLSFSSPDYIGHRFGPSSVEVEDNYLRLDRQLEEFFNYLDQKIGKGEYLVFISADHAVADVPNYMLSENIPAGNFNSAMVLGQLKGFATAMYGEGNWILSFSNEQVFLNHELIKSKKMNAEQIQRDLADYVLRFRGVKEAFTASDMRRQEFTQNRPHLLQMGYNHKASGDVLLILEPAWLVGGARGTTHGSGFSYDTHVPIAFYGWGIKAGKSASYATVTDIAPTLSVLLQIRMPNGTTGSPINEVINP
jgi:predicted AlkP superfamily pyrophosphatase or phosphodiesterase